MGPRGAVLVSIVLPVESLDEDGRVVDAREDLLLAPVPAKPGRYRTNRRVRVSSSVIEGFRERVRRAKTDPLPPGFADVRALRIVEGGSVRLSFCKLRAVYPLPLGS